MNDWKLDDYVEVNERVAAFHEKYPDGSLQGSFSVQTIADDTLIVYRAEAYRQPDDTRPGIGYASEPVPGKTPYTKDSELMNAETSAWGRALAALGFEVKRSIASKNEIQARQGTGEDRKPTQPQLDFLFGKGNRKGLIEKAGLSDAMKIRFRTWAEDEMTFSQASQLIEALKERPDDGAGLAIAWAGGVSDVPLEDDVTGR